MTNLKEVHPLDEATVSLEKLLKKQEAVGKPRGCDDTPWQEPKDE